MSKLLVVALGGGLFVYGYRYMVDKGKRLSDDQHVVIVGGGYGGARLAKELKGRGKFTLIDQRDAMHHNMAALRAAVEPGFAHKSFIPFEPSFSENFVQGKVIDIDMKNQQVVLENNSTVPYTQLVLATGSSGPFPGKCSPDGPSSKLAQRYEDFSNEIKQAKRIVVVGGGAVGVEMAGEIATDYPNEKQVTIVHNTDVLVSPVLVAKAQEIIAEKCASKKIDVVYGEKVTNLAQLPVNKMSEGLKVELSNGKVVEADLVIPCFGLSVNTEAYKHSLGDHMNEKGQLKVENTLKVEGTDNVFAIGDCNNCGMLKLASEAQEQGTCTYDNLINIAKGKPLSPYKPAPLKICLPIGRDGGLSQSGSKVLGDFMTKFIKSKDVFVKMMWSEFGRKPPT